MLRPSSPTSSALRRVSPLTAAWGGLLRSSNPPNAGNGSPTAPGGSNNNNSSSNNGNGGNGGNGPRRVRRALPLPGSRRPLSVFSGIRIDSQPLPEVPSPLPILPTGDNRVLLPGVLMRLHFKEPALSPVMEDLFQRYCSNSDLIVGCVPIVANADDVAAGTNVLGPVSQPQPPPSTNAAVNNVDSTASQTPPPTPTEKPTDATKTDPTTTPMSIDTTALAKTVADFAAAAANRQQKQGNRPNDRSRDRDISWRAVDPKQLYRWGCAARVIQFSCEESNISPFTKAYVLTLEGLTRFQINRFVETSPIFTADVTAFPDAYVPTTDVDLQASVMALRQAGHNLAGVLAQHAPADSGILDPLRHILEHTDSHRLPDLLTCIVDINLHEKLELLSAVDMHKRIKKMLEYISRQSEIITMNKRLQAAIDSELIKRQREILLRQKKMVIMKELGETDENDEDEAVTFTKKLKTAKLPEPVLQAAQKELSKLKKTPTTSAEYGVIRNYLDLLLELPWSKETTSVINMEAAQKQLDNDHYGLDKVKRRFLEYLAVLKLNPQLHGPILCLVGPPGVGKTSLGRSIATAMGREFYRISLGGVRDEAQIRGHRRTYVGAMPGLIIQALRRVSVNNPVILLDEIDKIGSDFRGDPSSALLEVLDPEQNCTFSDHYLNLPFDLSKVIFIATANSLDPIPEPLLDRMETISLSGYTIDEKVRIAKSHLVPKQITNHGMNPNNLVISDDALVRIATAYSRESGVRVLEREIAAVCRAKVVEYVGKKEVQGIPLTPQVASEDKSQEKTSTENEATSVSASNDNSSTENTKDTQTKAKPSTESKKSKSKKDTINTKQDSPKQQQQAKSQETPEIETKILEPKDYDPVVTKDSLETILGPEKYDDEISERVITPGVAVGLAWRASGSGGLLFVEATRMPGKGGLVLTGKLGDVIKESAQIGLSWVRSHWSYFNIATSDGFVDSLIPSQNDQNGSKDGKKNKQTEIQQFFANNDVHIHFPAGAIPKDGPSAGVTLVTAMVSLFTGIPVSSHLAMTGEVSLRGLVLPVGGIKEKLIAAHRGGVKTVIIPIKNKKDLIDVPQTVKDEMEIFFAERITDVLRIAFVGGEQSNIWRRNDEGILVANSHYKWQKDQKEKIQSEHHVETHHHHNAQTHNIHTSLTGGTMPETIHRHHSDSNMMLGGTLEKEHLLIPTKTISDSKALGAVSKL